MKILFVSAENSPFVQVGGLSQVVALLSKALERQGLDVRVFMPKYGIIQTKKYKLKTVTAQMSVPTGQSEKSSFPKELICNVLSKGKDKYFVPAYFLENREYYELRANVYGYNDEHIRFWLLSHGCLEWILDQKKKGGWTPEIIHAHDWHTGYLVEAIKRNPRYKELKNIKVLYTVHNFKHQGNFDYKYAKVKDEPKTPLAPCLSKELQMQNPLLRGLLYADHVNTVSPTYAREVQTPEFGEGLHTYLQKISSKLTGIPNGIDASAMNPETDKSIRARFSIKDLSRRNKNKLDLQKIFGLPKNLKIPIVSYVGRFAAQKGIETVLRTLENMKDLPQAQYIFVGGGDDNVCNEIDKLRQKYPKNIAALFRLDFHIPRKVFAGSDITLMPSRFEPGGIVAMEALRYGCVPLVADTGGLSETIKPYDLETGVGNGFLHERNNLWSFVTQLVSALQLFHVKNVWQKIQTNGMKEDYSWNHIAKEYIKLYKQLS